MNQNYTKSIQYLPDVQGLDVAVANRAELTAMTARIKGQTLEVSASNGPNPNI